MVRGVRKSGRDLPAVISLDDLEGGDGVTGADLGGTPVWRR